jgi:hypothetical protein
VGRRAFQLKADLQVSGGVIINVVPSTASSIVCSRVTTSGFALGNDDNIVSVISDGVPVNAIESQSKHEVVVLAATPSESFPAAGTGAVRIVASRTTARGEIVADYVSTEVWIFYYYKTPTPSQVPIG